MQKLILCTVFILLLTGCQGRTTRQLIDTESLIPPTTQLSSQEVNTVDDQAIPEVTTTKGSEEVLEITTTNTDMNTPTEATVLSSENASKDSEVTESSQSIIVAKSEDLNEIDERTMILNEIDALLDRTLNSLDQLEEDAISDENIVQEGGLN